MASVRSAARVLAPSTVRLRSATNATARTRSRTGCRARTACGSRTRAALACSHMKRRRRFELRRQRPRSRRCDVDGASRVVLAEARRRVDVEDLLDRLARRELAPNDVGLMANAAESRDEQQLHAGAGSALLHLAPRRGRFRARAAASCRRRSARRPRAAWLPRTLGDAGCGRSRSVFRGRRTARRSSCARVYYLPRCWAISTGRLLAAQRREHRELPRAQREHGAATRRSASGNAASRRTSSSNSRARRSIDC